MWNFGRQAYTLSQVAHLLAQKIPRLEPDVLVVQLYNEGVRPFHGDGSYQSETIDMLLDDRMAIHENFLSWGLELDPAVVISEIVDDRRAFAEQAFRRSAVVRALRAIQRSRHNNPHDSAFANLVDRQKVEDLLEVANAHGAVVLFVNIPAHRKPREWPEPMTWHLELYEPGRPEAFYDCHPPAPIFDEFAQRIAAEIRSHGVLPR